MITARQALDAALLASRAVLDRQVLAGFQVDPAAGTPARYTVHLVPLAAADRAEAAGWRVAVDAADGRALEPQPETQPNPLRDLEAEWRHSPVISAGQAWQAALEAIRGYEQNADAYGRLQVRLRATHYEVTFPDPAQRTQGGHTADYTYQVWIHARTAAVVKILVAP